MLRNFKNLFASRKIGALLSAVYDFKRPKRPITDRFRPETPALDAGGCSTPCSGRFTPKKRPGTHCTGGSVGPRVILDGCEKCRPCRDLIPSQNLRKEIHQKKKLILISELRFESWVSWITHVIFDVTLYVTTDHSCQDNDKKYLFNHRTLKQYNPLFLVIKPSFSINKLLHISYHNSHHQGVSSSTARGL